MSREICREICLGGIAGDIIGSRHEFRGDLSKSLPPDFPLFGPGCDFTDDSVMTLATMDALTRRLDFGETYLKWGRAFPNRGYGRRFQQWLFEGGPAYGSYGNGAAMRVSPVGWLDRPREVVLDIARATALPSHDHPEGIKGAQAVALAIWMALRGAAKHEVRWEVEHRFGYDLSRTCDEIRPTYKFDETCQGTVPAAFAAVLDAGDYEGAIRNAITLGGDADTLACIAGSIAEAWWDVPKDIYDQARAKLPGDLGTVHSKFMINAIVGREGREGMIRQAWGIE